MKFVYLVLVVLVFAKDEPEVLITNFEGGIQDLLWCGTDSSIMILRNENNKVYRGSNKGTIYLKKYFETPMKLKRSLKVKLILILFTSLELKANFGSLPTVVTPLNH